MVLELAFLLTIPYWLAMLFINGKVILEVNREMDLKSRRSDHSVKKR